MKQDTVVKLKVVAMVAFGLLATLAGMSYFGTFETEKRIRGISYRWDTLKFMPAPADSTVVFEQPLNDGTKPYGITLCRRLILDVSQLVDPRTKTTASDVVRQHYIDWFLTWHPDLTVTGRIEDGQTVAGEAGLVVVQTDGFWYEEIKAGRVHPDVAAIITDKYTPEDGRGRRFVIVKMIICTRPR